jgi:hypothetical protein
VPRDLSLPTPWAHPEQRHPPAAIASGRSCREQFFATGIVSKSQAFPLDVLWPFAADRPGSGIARRRATAGPQRSALCLIPTGRRPPLVDVTRGPNLLRLHPDGGRDHRLHRWPAVLEGFSRSRGMIAMSDGNPGEGLAPLLQGGQHIGGMPVLVAGRSSSSHGSMKFVLENLRKVCYMHPLTVVAGHGQAKKCRGSRGVYCGASASAS